MGSNVEPRAAGSTVRMVAELLALLEPLEVERAMTAAMVMIVDRKGHAEYERFREAVKRCIDSGVRS